MIRLYAIRYEELPSAERLNARIGAGTAALLTGGKRSPAARQTLLGFDLLSRMLPDVDLRTVARTAEGRPFLAGGTVDFSLSHTDGLIVCAAETAVASPRVGVDAEVGSSMTPERMERIAARWFLPGERDALGSPVRLADFLAVWTAKEAAVKFSGGGLREFSATRILSPSSARLADGRTVCVKSYRIPGAAVSLAYRPGAVPPEEIVFLSV